jgi:hypothetical protein
MDTDEHEEIFQNNPQIALMAQILFSAKSSSAKICAICGRLSVCEIEIRAAHEIMAARTTQLALLVDQLMAALRTKPPVLAGNVFVGRRAGINHGWCCFGFAGAHSTTLRIGTFVGLGMQPEKINENCSINYPKAHQERDIYLIRQQHSHRLNQFESKRNSKHEPNQRLGSAVCPWRFRFIDKDYCNKDQDQKWQGEYDAQIKSNHSQMHEYEYDRKNQPKNV